MSKRILTIFWIAVMLTLCAGAATAEPWVKGYVVAFYGHAFRYGGRADYYRGTEIEPGVDCSHGSTTHFTKPAEVAKTFSLINWRSPQEVETLANPPETGEDRNPAGLYFHTWRAASAYRGYNNEIQTYVNPFAAEDPGEPEVTGRIGEGFNLDGKIKSNDFVSPDGEKGIDNELYRAWGCDAPWRGDNGALVLRSNDKMVEGLYTVVIRISGNQDPMNDDDAVLEIGYSPDQIVKDARGNVGSDYSYRILQWAQYTKLKARVKDGVIETEQADIHMPQIAWFYNQQRDAFFRQGKIRVVPDTSGAAAGLVGGYRDWRDLYSQNFFSQDAGQQAVREHEDPIALYHALRRHADGMFNAKTGRYEGISTAYRMKLVPAFVVDPDKPMDIPDRSSEGRGKKPFDDTTAAMIKAVNTLVPQEVPAGSGELKYVDGIAIGRGGVMIHHRLGTSYSGDGATDDRAKGAPAAPRSAKPNDF